VTPRHRVQERRVKADKEAGMSRPAGVATVSQADGQHDVAAGDV
jgi:hypothetical protein